LTGSVFVVSRVEERMARVKHRRWLRE